MEKNNLSLTEQEGTQLGMALTTIMVNMTEHGRLTQEQRAQECKNILLQKNMRIIAEGDVRLGPGELQELLSANNMSEEEFAAREFEKGTTIVTGGENGSTKSITPSSEPRKATNL
ncbi:hypothetical protein EBB69_03530 [Lactobacillus delbrueckii]|nr:hypothetical protein [Lactobacillus delbrueckii]